MKKTNVLWAILNTIFLIVFNALFFVLGGFEHNASVWVSYGFIHFAYLMLLLTPMLIRGGKSKAVFGFSLFSISAAYFLVELITGAIFIQIAPESYKSAFLTQLCIAGLYGAVLVSNMIANERTAYVEVQGQNQIEFVKDASARLKGLLDRISDKGTRKKVEKAYDALYSSPVKSHPDLAEMEDRILLSVDEICDAVSEGNEKKVLSAADSLIAAIDERNRLLRAQNRRH